MIGVVDIGVGNIGSIYKLLNKLKVIYFLVEIVVDFVCVDKVIFSGVGFFVEVVICLENSGFKFLL